MSLHVLGEQGAGCGGRHSLRVNIRSGEGEGKKREEKGFKDSTLYCSLFSPFRGIWAAEVRVRPCISAQKILDVAGQRHLTG